MHVSSSQSNTATQTDDKTHTERTAAAARILVVRAGLHAFQHLDRSVIIMFAVRSFSELNRLSAK